jgi:hypothetical protein
MTVAQNMKISKKTLDILKNFAAIRSSILVDPGNRLTTVSPARNIMAEAAIDEEFDTQFAIYDLNKFLGTISLFQNPEFDFGPKSVVISGANGASVEYFYSEPSLLNIQNKRITMPKSVVSFELKQSVFGELMKAASVMQLPDIFVRSDDDGNIIIGATDKTQSTSNAYRMEVGKTDKSFNFKFKVENMKMMAGDYQVDITEKVVSKFTNKNSDLCYWIALESDSNYDG